MKLKSLIAAAVLTAALGGAIAPADAQPMTRRDHMMPRHHTMGHHRMKHDRKMMRPRHHRMDRPSMMQRMMHRAM